MGDVHIHAREDITGKETYKEDFHSVSQAAINGGVVHCCDMPNNPKAPIDDESYREKLNLIGKSQIPLFLYAGVGPETKPLSILVPYKVYMAPSVGPLFFSSTEQLENAIKNYEDCYVSFHCEDPYILDDSKDNINHFKRRPVEAELLATQTALRLIEKYNLKGKLCHYSASEGLVQILSCRKKNVSVQCEVTPQHLYFCEEDILKMPKEKSILFQMNPPIRERKERELMMEHFLKGDIDYLATDHAPHILEEKEKGISGLTGLDTYGGFVTWLIKEKNADPQLIAKVCCENPGDFVNQFLPSLKKMNKNYEKIPKGFGRVEKKYSASFTVLNMKKETLVERKKLKTKSAWSPFEGCLFPGRVEHVFVCGKELLKHGKDC